MGVKSFYKFCRKVKAPFWGSLRKTAIFRLKGKNIISHSRTEVYGLNNIDIRGELNIGMSDVGFQSPKDFSLINVRGKLIVNQSQIIARGCRLDIGPVGMVELNGGYINPFCKIVIIHNLKIGEGSAIGWNVQILDDDFHSLEYMGRIEKDRGIEIGRHVWIGSNVTVLKGTKIGDGCVVATNSLVNGGFFEPGCLIAGNPGKIIKRNVHWK